MFKFKIPITKVWDIKIFLRKYIYAKTKKNSPW